MMWALVYKEFVQLRNLLLQLVLAMVGAMLLLGSSLEGFVKSYLGMMPLVLALTLPQSQFGIEERGQTLVFLRSLPVRPRQIVAAKFVFSALSIMALLLISLIYAWSLGELAESLTTTGVFMIIASVLLSLSMFLHFRLGANAAKIALLVSLALFGGLGMLLMREQRLTRFIAESALVQWLLSAMRGWSALPLGLTVSIAILLLSYAASAWVFTRQDVSRIP